MGAIMARVVTVFGGSGFVGKQVVRALARQGWRIKVAVRHATLAYDLKPMGDVGQIQVVRCDVRKEADIARALDGADACVNLVGIAFQTLSQSFEDVHRKASAAMAQVCAAKGIKSFVLLSALGANPKAGSSYYASKGRAEDSVRRAVPQAVVLRPSVIFGPEDSFFTGLAQQIKQFPFMPAIGGANNKFQPVYVGDVASAVARTLGNEKAFGQTYELGGPEVFAFKDLLKYVSAEIMTPRTLIYLPYAAASGIGIGGDIMAAIGFRPLLTTDQVLMLKRDNVVSAGAKGLKDLGIGATAIESTLPTYLWRFRKNGQFAVPAQG
jgi:NADH dehydrogenase